MLLANAEKIKTSFVKKPQVESKNIHYVNTNFTY